MSISDLNYLEELAEAPKVIGGDDDYGGDYKYDEKKYYFKYCDKEYYYDYYKKEKYYYECYGRIEKPRGYDY